VIIDIFGERSSVYILGIGYCLCWELVGPIFCGRKNWPIMGDRV
jgi:hypothetical protein